MYAHPRLQDIQYWYNSYLIQGTRGIQVGSLCLITRKIEDTLSNRKFAADEISIYCFISKRPREADRQKSYGQPNRGSQS